MKTFATGEDNVIIRLDPGDLVLESIRAACTEQDVDTGAVVSAIGTLRNLNVHYLHTDVSEDKDDRNTMVELDGYWEIAAIQGLIADGDPHLHVTAWDGDRTLAGHLEEGNEVNALGEVLIERLDHEGLTRTPNEYDVSMLERR